MSKRAIPVINDKLKPTDQDLFQKLVKRWREVDDEARMLKAQLVESKGLQNEIHLRTDIIEDLQRQ
eukprot:10035271-Heterocapsa_arctica.AAC.1